MPRLPVRYLPWMLRDLALAQGAVLKEPSVAQIGQAHQKSPAQVLLRWHVQHGLIVIPKSMHRARMEENAAIFDFELTSDEMAALNALDMGEDGRIGPHPSTFTGVIVPAKR